MNRLSLPRGSRGRESEHEQSGGPPMGCDSQRCHKSGEPAARVIVQRQRGSAMVIAVLIVVILTLLGLAFMLAGDTESKIARNQRDAAQAGFIAEGGVRAVKKWFDYPSGPASHLVPTVAQMDR